MDQTKKLLIQNAVRGIEEAEGETARDCAGLRRDTERALELLIGALFSDSLTSSIGVPFLLPSVGTLAAIGAATAAATMLAGALTAAFSARKVSKQDTGVILRGDN